MTQTKFRPSIVNYASVSDCQMILEELIEDLDSQINAYKAKCEQLEAEGKDTLFIKYHGKMDALLDMQINLINKKLEVRDRHLSR